MSQRTVVGNAGLPSVPNTYVAMQEVKDRAFAPEAVAASPARVPVRQHAPPLAVDTMSANARAAEARGDSGLQDPHNDRTRRVWGGWSSPASAAADQSGGGTGGRNRNVGSPPAIDGGAVWPQALERQSSRAASRGKIAGVDPRVGMEADITFQQRIPPPPDDQPPHMNQSLIIRIRLDGFGGGCVVLPPVEDVAVTALLSAADAAPPVPTLLSRPTLYSPDTSTSASPTLTEAQAIVAKTRAARPSSAVRSFVPPPPPSPLRLPPNSTRSPGVCGHRRVSSNTLVVLPGATATITTGSRQLEGGEGGPGSGSELEGGGAFQKKKRKRDSGANQRAVAATAEEGGAERKNVNVKEPSRNTTNYPRGHELAIAGLPLIGKDGRLVVMKRKVGVGCMCVCVGIDFLENQSLHGESV